MTTVVQVAIDEQNPWPGLGSFDEGSERFFIGRRNETAELRRLVLNAPLTVLFGASGLGKTSLVQAGLFPQLRKEHYLPIYVRLDLRDRAAPLIDQVKFALQTQLRARRVDAPSMHDDELLWSYLHRSGLELWSEHNQLLTPIFVFDQFEEVFTLGADNPAAIARLRIDLADLIENRLPSALVDTVERNEAAGQTLSRSERIARYPERY
jgi:AAA+ ATPase superfamily predicted ATPase